MLFYAYQICKLKHRRCRTLGPSFGGGRRFGMTCWEITQAFRDVRKALWPSTPALENLAYKNIPTWVQRLLYKDNQSSIAYYKKTRKNLNFYPIIGLTQYGASMQTNDLDLYVRTQTMLSKLCWVTGSHVQWAEFCINTLDVQTQIFCVNI